MKDQLLLLLAQVLCLLFLLPGAEAIYFHHSYDYGCSISCFAGAVTGSLVTIGLLIGLIVFCCCYCKSKKTRNVRPDSNVMVISTVGSSGGFLYPTQPQQQYPMQLPAYNQSQMYPPGQGMHPPAYHPGQGMHPPAYHPEQGMHPPAYHPEQGMHPPAYHPEQGMHPPAYHPEQGMHPPQPGMAQPDNAYPPGPPPSYQPK